MNFQSEKQLLLDFYDALDKEPETKSVFKKYVSDEVIWRGFHPFNEIYNSETVYKLFWEPLKKSLSSLTRRMDIFLQVPILFLAMRAFGLFQWAT